MMTPHVRRWLSEASPPAPDRFRPWLEGGTADPVSELDGAVERVRTLAEVAAGALGACLEGGAERAAAFRLLEADALLTYACEAAADAPDPEAALLLVLGKVAGERD